jgi:hypothetical protein
MDEFKKYLQQHRSDMDVDAPGEQLLQRIQTQSAGKKKAPLYTMILRYAAVACVLAAIAFGLRLLTKTADKKQKDLVTTEKQTPVKNEPGSLKKEPVADPLNNTAPVTARNIPSISEAGPVRKKQTLPYLLMNSFEHNYNQLVNLQLKNIRNTPVYGEAPDYFDGFKKTFFQIDNDEQSIKKHIKTEGLNDALLEQLINVYQEKLNVLKNLQQEINKMNKKLEDNQQPSDTLTSHFINI